MVTERSTNRFYAGKITSETNQVSFYICFFQAFFATKQNHLFRFDFADESIHKLGTIGRTSPLKGFASLGDDR